MCFYHTTMAQVTIVSKLSFSILTRSSLQDCMCSRCYMVAEQLPFKSEHKLCGGGRSCKCACAVSEPMWNSHQALAAAAIQALAVATAAASADSLSTVVDMTGALTPRIVLSCLPSCIKRHQVHTQLYIRTQPYCIWVQVFHYLIKHKHWLTMACKRFQRLDVFAISLCHKQQC